MNTKDKIREMATKMRLTQKEVIVLSIDQLHEVFSKLELIGIFGTVNPDPDPRNNV